MVESHAGQHWKCHARSSNPNGPRDVVYPGLAHAQSPQGLCLCANAVEHCEGSGTRPPPARDPDLYSPPLRVALFNVAATEEVALILATQLTSAIFASRSLRSPTNVPYTYLSSDVSTSYPVPLPSLDISSLSHPYIHRRDIRI